MTKKHAFLGHCISHPYTFILAQATFGLSSIVLPHIDGSRGLAEYVSHRGLHGEVLLLNHGGNPLPPNA